MAQRYSALIIVLSSLGLCFFAINQSDSLSAYESALTTTAIIASTFSAFALAVGSLRSISFLYVTRSAGITLLIATALITPPTLVTIAMVITSIIHLCWYSETLISRFTFDSGIANENVFILRSPYSVITWFTFSWTVMWATVLECIHLYITDKWIFGTIALVVAGLIIAFFLPSQMRILLRRCVIVPQGVVIADLISLTDVVLFPLAKIAQINCVASSDALEENAFTTTHTHGDVVEITLTEHTDSLIVRDFVNETTRKNVDKVILSIATPQRFVSVFHDRFHHVDAPELTRSQEIMAEKELGVETAPRSDEKLPQWRKKKTK